MDRRVVVNHMRASARAAGAASSSSSPRGATRAPASARARPKQASPRAPSYRAAPVLRPQSSRAVDDTRPSHGDWKAHITAAVTADPRVSVARSQALIPSLEQLAGQDATMSEVLKSGSPRSKAVPHGTRPPARAYGRWMAGTAAAEARVARERWLEEAKGARWVQAMVDPNAAPRPGEETMPPEYLERANNLRRSYFSLTGGIEIEFGGSRDFKGHGGLEELGSFFKQQGARHGAAERKGSSWGRMSRCVSGRRVSRRSCASGGSMTSVLTLDRWGDVVSTRLLVGGCDGCAGGTDEAVTGLLGSDVDQTLPIDLVGHEYGETGYSSQQVARWQPLARAEDGKALWRASHGKSWHASDGAPRPPPEIAPKALRIKAARDPTIPGLGTAVRGSGVVPELEQALEACVPGQDDADEEGSAERDQLAKLEKAAEGFSERHHCATYRANCDAVAAATCADARLARRFDRSIEEVRRNRYYVDVKYDPYTPVERSSYQRRVHKPVTKRERRKRYTVDASSIWAPRARTSNAKSLYETDEALRKMFHADWEFSRQGHGLEDMISRVEGSWSDSDGNGIDDSIDNAREALCKHVRLFYGAFDTYAVLFSETSTRQGEFDVFNITFNAWMEFARECQLVGERLKMRDLEIIWVQVNAIEVKTKDMDPWNHSRTFTRHEWLQALVRVAIQRYTFGRGGKSVSLAIDTLARHVRDRLPRETRHDGNAFRDQYCYLPLIEQTLGKHEATLRNVFERYADVNHDVSDRLQSKTAISVGEWMIFLDDIGLIDNGQISPLRAKMIFVWSRIRGCPDASDRATRSLRNLQFEDFLEALIRLSIQMVLPNDDEIEEGGASDGGQYLIALENAMLLDDFIAERRQPWWKEPSQRVWRCLEHLLTYIVRVIELDVSVGGRGNEVNLTVEASEIAEFERRRRKNSERHMVDNCAKQLATSLVEGEARVREKLLMGLRAVDIFSALNEEQLVTLRDGMMHAPFEVGQYVFEQARRARAVWGVCTCTRARRDLCGRKGRGSSMPWLRGLLGCPHHSWRRTKKVMRSTSSSKARRP
mmetsp:Transcript_1620/g.4844  ORF Transcript_1620/g.4844 Transcript_1620/m.4844 type:complete len:1055 (+) Transcript_1620:77-3241(+)